MRGPTLLRSELCEAETSRFGLPTTILPMTSASPISTLMRELLLERSDQNEFLMNSRYAERVGAPDICDFVFGNPHEMPLPEFGEALAKAAEARSESHFAYKMSEPGACQIVAESLRDRFAVDFDANDVVMTNGAFAGIAVVLRTILDPGDEVVYPSPPWFGYVPIIRASGGREVRVVAAPPSFDLDPAGIERAITPRTRAVIINSPNNPTGRIYTPERLREVSEILAAASAKHGRTIYLISDEAYNRILFDGAAFTTPTAYYPASFLIYTYGKTLLTPGQRMGYVALNPSMSHKTAVLAALTTAQVVSGWAFPDAVMQHAISDLEGMSIDLKHLQSKRDRMLEMLRGSGYSVHKPEGTFYLLPRAPIEDDVAFTRSLAEHDVFVLPGKLVELPGYFRISLTASEEMIHRSEPGFAKAIAQHQ